MEKSQYFNLIWHLSVDAANIELSFKEDMKQGFFRLLARRMSNWAVLTTHSSLPKVASFIIGLSCV